MHFFGEIKKWLGEITEIALLLIALGVAAEILFGDTVPFLSQIVPNITNIIASLGDKGLVGLVSLGIIVFLFYRKKAVV
jgi:ABC-type enterochelin transport system permease subunit